MLSFTLKLQPGKVTQMTVLIVIVCITSSLQILCIVHMPAFSVWGVHHLPVRCNVMTWDGKPHNECVCRNIAPTRLPRNERPKRRARGNTFTNSDEKIWNSILWSGHIWRSLIQDVYQHRGDAVLTYKYPLVISTTLPWMSCFRIEGLRMLNVFVQCVPPRSVLVAETWKEIAVG